MSKYTTELRFICETLAGLNESVGYDNVKEVIESSRGKIFDFEYPIFDENYKAVIETKIIKHYYTREIGLETYGLWKLKLDEKMNLMMPYFNKLYKAELIEFNPLYDIDLTRDHKTTSESNNQGSENRVSDNTTHNTTNENDKSTGWSLFNDTPQNGLQGVENMTYLTTATKNTNDSNINSNSTVKSNEKDDREYQNKINGIEDYIEHVKGTNGGMSFSKRIVEFRDSLINVDKRVINELKDLFIYLW